MIVQRTFSSIAEGYDPTDRATALKLWVILMAWLQALSIKIHLNLPLKKHWLLQMVVHILVH
mgnify:CR=1 FL=1